MFYWNWLSDLIHGPKTTRFPGHFDPEVALNGESHHIEEGDQDAGPLRRAMAIRHLDSGSCQGCESEIQLLSSPDYDFSRFGFSFTPSPRHADILVVTGVVTESMAAVIEHVFQGMPAPKRVVALGQCAIDGHVFAGAPGVIGSLRDIVPVTVEITGCPPTPGDILRGLLESVEAYGFEQGESADERRVLG